MAEIEELFAPLHGHALYNVAQYRTKFGEPDEEISFSEIKKATENALMRINSPGEQTFKGKVLSDILFGEDTA